MTPQTNLLKTRVALTPAEFAEVTGLKTEAVYRAIRDGKVKAEQFGRLYVIPVAEVHRLFPAVTASDAA